jgi:DNA-directed RNA polymerase subunit M/transcription elongation factor TFIIS
MQKKTQIRPSSMQFHEPRVGNLLKCPYCGNESDFFEITDDVITTTHYIQNRDGSFTIENKNSQSLGDVKLFCGNCEEDLSSFHQRFSEMIF